MKMIRWIPNTPVDIFITFVRDESRRRNCLSLRRINRMNVRNAALILKRKIFFWPNNEAGHDDCRRWEGRALRKTDAVAAVIGTRYRSLRRDAG